MWYTNDFGDKKINDTHYKLYSIHLFEPNIAFILQTDIYLY